MRIKNLLVPAFCALSVAFALPVQAQDSGAGDDPVVARVGGEDILQSEVLALAQNLPPQQQSQIALIFPQLIEQVIDLRLVGKAGRDAGLADDEEVRERVMRAESQIISQIYVLREIEAQVTDEKIRAEYDKFVTENPPQKEIRARHILVEEEDQAKNLIVELDGGADFAALAGEHSTGPSGSQGGDLGFFGEGQMVPEFSEAAFAMEAGQHSKEPVKTQFGWHVIKVEESRLGEQPAFEDMEADLRSELSRGAYQDIVAKLREGAEIEIVTPDAEETAPATEGTSESTSEGTSQ
ncbi:peptidylprolyl isomerase [Pelagibius sp. Alg239-R121]|uniref:peptidylprolyl isomerase n=1 Tax=Pelagibius sp. Alg239-R121 TaxID=2993448 RepID=UPI0024A70E08|nr:peptidylprolyl isomerase [Pelagibius sp. Alg239-R121]